MARTSKTIKTAGVWGHLLLVVLALGIFAMHTVGHPDAESGASHGGDRMAATSSTSTVLAVSTVFDGTHSAASQVPAVQDAGGDHDAAGSGMAMDMLSLCMAVLGTWILAALLKAALVRSGDRSPRRRTGVPVAPLRGPPPRGPDLSSLSILRI
ncbi:DUF6153 family protein [Streptomyces sp. NPDC048057]|uniref:DUF6153 family protein n=1 Tax=Streptomyces sp. NPDC048057 TaxID=3155628 RepID=UPI0033CBFF65